MTRAMIQLSPRGNVIYQFLSLTVSLLLLYALGFLLSAVYQLPANPLTDLVSAERIDAFASQMFKLAVLTGYLGAGIMMAGEALNVLAVMWWRRIWTVVAVLTVALSISEFSHLLDSATALVLLFLLACSVRPKARTIFFRVWQIGMLLVAISLLAGALGDAATADVLAAFQVHVAFALVGLSIFFWLMPRYSHVETEWAQDGLAIVAALVFLAGSLISLGRLGLPALISLGATPLIALCYLILASHSSRALRSRNENASLAPHWIALATLFWLVGGGFLGALSIQPGISAAMPGTDLKAAQSWLSGWVSLTIALAFVNEAATSLRGDNRRVTGYLPFWLIAFGVGLSTIAVGCRGVVQIYLRDIAAVELMAEAELLMPLTLVWIICLLAVSAGIGTYALGFWLRRPEIRVVEG